MLVHIGAGYLVRDSSVIGIFDLDGEMTPAITSEFLKKAQKREVTDAAGYDLPRSFVLCDGGKDGKKCENSEKVILSHISSSSLYKRCTNDGIRNGR